MPDKPATVDGLQLQLAAVVKALSYDLSDLSPDEHMLGTEAERRMHRANFAAARIATAACPDGLADQLAELDRARQAVSEENDRLREEARRHLELRNEALRLVEPGDPTALLSALRTIEQLRAQLRDTNGE